MKDKDRRKPRDRKMVETKIEKARKRENYYSRKRVTQRKETWR